MGPLDARDFKGSERVGYLAIVGVSRDVLEVGVYVALEGPVGDTVSPDLLGREGGLVFIFGNMSQQCTLLDH